MIEYGVVYWLDIGQQAPISVIVTKVTSGHVFCDRTNVFGTAREIIFSLAEFKTLAGINNDSI